VIDACRYVIGTPFTSAANRAAYWAFHSAIADRPEPDPSEPVASEPGGPVAEPDGHDLDVMGHPA
jgi:hypothetical protein